MRQNAKDLVTTQHEICKEVPRTALLLKSKGHISRSQILDSDISFKVQEYFDYKHGNLKESFFQEVPAELKAADRKLLHSKHLVMKKHFSSSQIAHQEESSKKISNIDATSQKLLSCVAQKAPWESIEAREKSLSKMRSPQKKKLQNLNSKIFNYSGHKPASPHDAFQQAKLNIVTLLESHEKSTTRKHKSHSINPAHKQTPAPCDLARSIRYMKKKKLTIVGAARLRALMKN